MADLHKHLIVDATFKNSPTEPHVLEQWLSDLVVKIDMEVFMEPSAKYCDDPTNAGVTGIVGLTTSHSSAHFWHTGEHPHGKLDLYSCKEYSVETFLDHLKVFEPIHVSYMVIERTPDENGLTRTRVTDQREIYY